MLELFVYLYVVFVIVGGLLRLMQIIRGDKRKDRSDTLRSDIQSLGSCTPSDASGSGIGSPDCGAGIL